MPLRRINFQPGINTQATPTLNRAGWAFSQLIRWREATRGQWVPEKLGGWLHINNTPFVGVARGLHSFADLLGIQYVGVGTNSRLEIASAGAMTDITPIRATTNPAPAFSTTINSTSVNVHDVAHGANVGDWVNIVVPVSIGGIVLYGFYLVATVVGANDYTITAASPATSTVAAGGAVPLFNTTNTSTDVLVTLNNHGLAPGNIFNVDVSTTVATIVLSGQYLVISTPTANTFHITGGSAANATTSGSENGGNARIAYLLASGLVSAGGTSGYGTGGFGLGGYSLGSGATIPTALRQWFLDNWGQQLVGNPTNGALYAWNPPVQTGNPATTITNSPLFSTASFVAMPQQILVSLGAETGGSQDPNLIRWSDVANYNLWVAAANNQAGSFRLPTGSRIVGGLQAPQQALIWTDVDLWAMQYQQPPFVFGFNKISSGCGLISARAAALLGTAVAWMSQKKFWVLDGNGLRELPCTVWDFIFTNLNIGQADKIFAFPNSLFGEITWHFPSASGNGECDLYVKVHLETGLWDFGVLPRTAGTDQAAGLFPITADLTGLLQAHETSADADGAPLAWMVRSGYADMDDGDFFTAFNRVVPDAVETNGGNYNISIYAVNTPNDQVVRKIGPIPCTPKTPQIFPRGRGMQIALQFDGNDLGSRWRLGGIRYEGFRDGKR